MLTSDRLDDRLFEAITMPRPSKTGLDPAGAGRQSVLETHFARGAIRKIAASQTLWSEGDEVQYAYLVRSGCLRLSQMLPDGRRAVHNFAFPGDVVGLGSIVHGRNAEAVEATSLFALSLPWLLQAARDDPVLQGAISAVDRRWLRSMQEHVTVLSRLAAGERLAHFLMEMSEQSRRNGGDPLRMRLPMRRIDVADYLGLTVETVCRTLTSFRNAGLIVMNHTDELCVRNLTRLSALATGESEPDDPMRRAS